MNLTLFKVIGVLALRNDPEEMISKTPGMGFAASPIGSTAVVIIDDVDPVTDIVTDRDRVTDALIDAENEAVVTELLDSVKSDSLNDEDSTTDMVGPRIVPTYCPLHAGSSINTADSDTPPGLEPLEVNNIDCEE